MQDFKQRTFQFTVGVGKLIIDLPNTVVNRVYFNQLVKSSSSTGANYRAAKQAKSDADLSVYKKTSGINVLLVS